jgi:hypothetical protein
MSVIATLPVRLAQAVQRRQQRQRILLIFGAISQRILGRPEFAKQSMSLKDDIN